MNQHTIVLPASASCSPLKIARVSKSDGTQSSRETRITTDVLIVHDESDHSFVNYQLVPILKNGGIRSETLNDKISAGRTLVQQFGMMTKNINNVLFVLSKSFSTSQTLPLLASIAVQFISYENVVCLRIDDKIEFEDNLRYLSRTRCVVFNENDWEERLQYHIRFRSPKYARIIHPRTVSQCLQYHGHDLVHMSFDIYGLYVKISNITIQVDVDKFMQHMKEHTHSGTHLACVECHMLRSPSSAVSFIFGDDFKKNKEHGAFDNVMTYLCSNILDVLTLRQAHIPIALGCTLRGRPVRNSSYIRKLWLEIMTKGLSAITAKENVVKCPENKDEEKRYATFPSLWHSQDVPSARSLARAGFYFRNQPHATRCFMCGYSFGTWRKDDDPMRIHAALNMLCPFVLSRMDDMCIQSALQGYICSRYQANAMYNMISSRTKSFETVVNRLFEQGRISELAAAGFYYTGLHDIVACFSCGIMLTNLSSSKRVWVTHAKLSPNCPFLTATKGNDYIEDILDVVSQEVPRTMVTFKLRRFDDSKESQSDMFLFTSSTQCSKELETSSSSLQKGI